MAAHDLAAAMRSQPTLSAAAALMATPPAPRGATVTASTAREKTPGRPRAVCSGARRPPRLAAGPAGRDEGDGGESDRARRTAASPLPYAAFGVCDANNFNGVDNGGVASGVDRGPAASTRGNDDPGATYNDYVMNVPERTMAGLAARGCENPPEERTTRTK